MLNEHNEWGESIPEPGEAFSNRAIHPVNLIAEQRKSESVILSRRELKRVVKERDRLYKQLDETGYFNLRTEFSRLNKLYLQRLLAVESMTNPDRLKGLSAEELSAHQVSLQQEEELIAKTQAQGAAISEEAKALRHIVEAYRDANARIEAHFYALERERYHDQLNKEMASEAQQFADIIIQRWSQLGFKHDTLHRKKRVVHRVQFDRIEITEDAIWYKIAVSRKGIFRYKNILPYGVRVSDLVSEDTLKELSTACQRQVTGKQLPSGGWIRVNRLGTRDGLVPYVTLDQVLRHYPKQDRDRLPVGVGVGEGRVISWVHIAKFPHFLIGGSTGGGKSNAINVIVCTLISKHSPAEVQFVLIDLKEGLEFQHFEKIPHLLMPVVTELDQAAEVLQQLETLRVKRSLQIKNRRVKDIDQYNELAKLHGDDPMPRVVVIFDEYAAIKQNKEMERSIQSTVTQLVNKGRAAGVHIMLCTQNPSVEIVEGHTKANMNFRLAGVMPTASASMTILGVGDAATLPATIPGRMIAMAGAARWPVQTAHVREIDLRVALKAADQWREKDLQLDTVTVKLPESQGAVGFTVDDLIALSIENLEGSLGARTIYESIKETQVASLGEITKMVKRIVESGENITYNGTEYKVVKVNRGYGFVEAKTEIAQIAG